MLKPRLFYRRYVPEAKPSMYAVLRLLAGHRKKHPVSWTLWLTYSLMRQSWLNIQLRALKNSSNFSMLAPDSLDVSWTDAFYLLRVALIMRSLPILGAGAPAQERRLQARIRLLSEEFLLAKKWEPMTYYWIRFSKGLYH
jgi:hypothetical protein